MKKTIQTSSEEGRCRWNVARHVLERSTTRLKAISHYEKEKYTTFDALRIALRKIEKDKLLDEPPKHTKGTSKKVVAKLNMDDDGDDDEIKGMLKVITSRLDKLESGGNQQHQQQEQQHSQYGYQGGNRSLRGRGFRGNNSYRGNNFNRGNYRGEYNNRGGYNGRGGYQGNSYTGNQNTQEQGRT